MKLNCFWTKWLPLVLILTAIKILLIPSYRSTDFDVHRNWLALTRELPLSEWYFDDVNGTTVHTLDYPPSFAFFEYFLSNNPITNFLLKRRLLDERCLALLPDNDNTPSQACVIFHRGTVILSDVVFYIGSYIASRAMWPQTEEGDNQKRLETTLLLLWCNPGLIWLDHIHFQYNGMLCGLLLASIGFIIQASEITNKQDLHLLAAGLYAILITFKHLYLTLAPLYFIYLLRRYCFVSVVADGTDTRYTFSWRNFIKLAFLTGLTLVSPFMPFLVQNEPVLQMKQILSRLFPFQRGLTHDYWAANVWALYMTGDKIVSFLSRRVGFFAFALPDGLPEISPRTTVVLLLVGLAPALYCAWHSAAALEVKKRTISQVADRSDAKSSFVWPLVFCSLSAFMLAYHVHEKAILTALVPMTVLAAMSMSNTRLYLRMSVLGQFGLLPLLFRPVELLFKYSSFLLFHALAAVLLWEVHRTKTGHIPRLVTKWDKLVLLILGAVALFMEIIHPLFLRDRMEFLPLLLTSVTCSVGLGGCWIQSGQLMLGSAQKV